MYCSCLTLKVSPQLLVYADDADDEDEARRDEAHLILTWFCIDIKHFTEQHNHD